MTILEEEVWVGLGGGNKKYYESLGYVMPKTEDRWGRIRVARGAKLLVKVVDLPKGSHVELTKTCDDCGEVSYNQFYEVILRQRNEIDGKDRCQSCGASNSKRIAKENVPYEKSLEYWAKTNNKEYLLEEFSDKNKKKPSEISFGVHDEYLWNCHKCTGEYPAKVYNRKNGRGCPYCSGRKALVGFNDLWTVNPEVAKLLFDPEDGYKYTKGSNKKVDWKCLECENKITNKTINDVTNKGLYCPRCSDGISYPEKFMYSILKQLNIEFETQKVFEWSHDKRYDFYMHPNIVIEVHGEQHYDGGFESLGGKSLSEEIENDLLKENMAKQNNLNYIVINARYSEMEWIKNSITTSELSGMFNLSEVNWIDAHEFSCNSLVKLVCDLWKGGVKSTFKISELTKLHFSTVTKYLKQGAEIGWCDYDPKEEQQRASVKKGKNAIPIVRLTLQGEYIDEFESAAEARRVLGIQSRSISVACSGKYNTAGGFVWVYKKEYDKNKAASYYRKTNKPTKSVVQLTLNGEFIREWESITEAGDTLSVQPVSISKVCKGKRKKAGGYKWMYKKEYDKNNDTIIPYKRNTQTRSLIQLTLNGEFIKEWDSITEAGIALSISSGSISSACRGKLKTTGKFKWMYKEDYNEMKYTELNTYQ